MFVDAERHMGATYIERWRSTADALASLGVGAAVGGGAACIEGENVETMGTTVFGMRNAVDERARCMSA